MSVVRKPYRATLLSLPSTMMQSHKDGLKTRWTGIHLGGIRISQAPEGLVLPRVQFERLVELFDSLRRMHPPLGK